MADKTDLPRLLADLIRAAFDYDTIDANVYAEKVAEHLDLIEFEPGDDGRPFLPDAETVAGALREALAATCAPGDDQPLTCVRCWNSPASRLLVIHWREETIRMLCGDCAEVDAADARDLPAFRMATVLTIGTLPAPGAPGWQKAAAGEPCLTDSQRFQVDEARDVLVNWGLVQAGVTSRETVLADQVRHLLAIVDQAFPGQGGGNAEG